MSKVGETCSDIGPFAKNLLRSCDKLPRAKALLFNRWGAPADRDNSIMTYLTKLVDIIIPFLLGSFIMYVWFHFLDFIVPDVETCYWHNYAVTVMDLLLEYFTSVTGDYISMNTGRWLPVRRSGGPESCACTYTRSSGLYCTIGAFSSIITLLLYARLVFHRPPVPPLAIPNTYSTKTVAYECMDQKGSLAHCTKGRCNGRWKPPRAHHCSACGQCRLGFDHHCHFVGLWLCYVESTHSGRQGIVWRKKVGWCSLYS